jgi:predicted enzyme related to lactoylglutathione lyase
MEFAMVNLYRVILPVPDIEDATNFYASVFETAGSRVSPGRHYFDCEGTLLALYDPVADGDEVSSTWRYHHNQYLYFGVTDLEAVHGRLRTAGGVIDSAIETMPWGERILYARDPFGSPIAFVDSKTIFCG